MILELPNCQFNLTINQIFNLNLNFKHKYAWIHKEEDLKDKLE